MLRTKVQMYVFISCFIVCNLVDNLLSLIYIIRSRNGIYVGEISFLNFMVGCTVCK